jgi:hypothetical protein
MKRRYLPFGEKIDQILAAKPKRFILGIVPDFVRYRFVDAGFELGHE